MSFTVQQDVLRLQIAVDDFFEVEVLYCAYDLRGIEQARGVAEAPAAAQVAEELSAWDEVHQHVQEALIVVGPKSEKSEQKKKKGGFNQSSVEECYSTNQLVHLECKCDRTVVSVELRK